MKKIIVFKEGKFCAGKLDKFWKQLETATNDKNPFLNAAADENEQMDDNIEKGEQDLGDDFLIVEAVNHDHM